MAAEPSVSIDAEVRELWPQTALGCVFWSAPLHDACPELWEVFAAAVRPDLQRRLETTALADMPEIGPSRQAFKAFGRDPGRVRVSSEALYRRLRQGNDLYRVNSVVDANNLVSLATGFSLGTYNLRRLSGDIVLRLGRKGESYAGIGKGTLDLHRMPLLADAEGPFGCPCSDSRRGMIAGDEAAPDAPMRLLTVIYGFSGPQTVAAALAVAREKFAAFAAADAFRPLVVCSPS